MPNVKPEGTQRVYKKYMLDPENIAYIEDKGLRFQRGKRSGASEALNRMVKLVRDWEANN